MEPHQLTQVNDSQRLLRLRIQQLSSHQRTLAQRSRALRETARAQLFASRRYGSGGLELIHKREVYDVPLNEALPTVFYGNLVEQLETRAQSYVEQMGALEQALVARVEALQQGNEKEDIGRIHRVVLNQQEALDRMTQRAGVLHREIELLRARYIGARGVSPAVFDEEERREALRLRKKQLLVKDAMAAMSRQGLGEGNTIVPPQQAAPSTGFGSSAGQNTLGSFGAPQASPVSTNAFTTPSVSFGGALGGFMGPPAPAGGGDANKLNRKKGLSGRKF